MNSALWPAVEAASVELAQPRLRHEIYAKEGETYTWRWHAGRWEKSHAVRGGVACRLAGEGTVAFASAAGSAASAGRDAARLALATRHPGPDPLPPRGVLGSVATPAVPPLPTAAEVERCAVHLAHSLVALPLRIDDIRVVAGWSRALLVTGEGYSSTAISTGAVIEARVGRGQESDRLVHVALRCLPDLPPERFLQLVLATVGPALPLVPPRRGLSDVLVAPAVAAPLLQGLLEMLGPHPRGRREVSPAWALVDARGGPQGLLPIPFDGEGLPSRSVALVSSRRVGRPALTWRDAGGDLTRAGGAVRASYADPPTSGFANLVMAGGAQTLEELTQACDGWHLLAPAGGVRLDRVHDRLALPVAGVRLVQGEPVAAWPRMELRASSGRLLRALEAAANDARSFSLRTAVTTPSLLFRQLELA